MNYKHLFGWMMCGAVALALPACGDDKNEPEVPEPGDIVTPEPNPGDKLYTPEESKDFLDATAREFLDKFNSADQQKVISLCSYFSEEYGDLELPEEFYYDEDELADYSPRKFMSALGEGLRNNDPSALTRATTYTYDVDFNHFRGRYKPAGYSWKKVGDSNDLIFEFTNRAGQACSIKVTASNETSNENLEFTDEWYDGYYGETNKEIYKYNIQLPRQVNVAVIENGQTLMTGVINSQVSIANHTMTADVTTNVANLQTRSIINGTDNQISSSTVLLVDGQQVMTARANINGSNLCNYNYIKNRIEDEDFDALNFIKTGQVQADVLGKVQIDGDITLSQSVLDALDEMWWDAYDGSQEECEKAAKRTISTLRNNLVTKVRYNNTGSTQATLDYKTKYYDSYYGWGEIEVVPLLRFNDDTTYEFDSYFGSGFGKVTNNFDSLVDSYERAWNRK